MKVKEILKLLTKQATLILKGSSSGKIYYNSDNHTLKTRQKYENYECSEKPIDVIIRNAENIAYPCIVIWFKDYLVNKNL